MKKWDSRQIEFIGVYCVQSDMNGSVNESDKHKNLRSELGEKT